MTDAVNRKSKLEWLQVARAFAALYVAAYHAGGRVDRASPEGLDWYQYVRFGNAGVDLFFVISGFVIVFAHYGDLGRPERFARYAYRRFTRIYPPYWVLFFCVMPLYFLFPDAGEEYQRQARSLIGGLLLLPIPPKPVIGIAWSLLFEILFYTVFGLVISNKRIGLVIIGLWLVGIAAYNGFGRSTNYYIGFLFSYRILYFACGAAIAYHVITRGRGQKFGWLAPLGLLGLTLGPQILAGSAAYDDEPGSLKFVYLASSAAIVFGSISLDATKRSPPRLLVELGNASYSIYLFHWVVGWVLDAGMKTLHVYRFLPYEVWFVFLFVVMVSLSYVAYLIVEKPLLGLSHAWWLRLTRVSQSVTPAGATS